MKCNYKQFVGYSKLEMLEYMGCNKLLTSFTSNTWKYILKKNWCGFNTIGYIYFEEEIVVNIKIVKKFKRTNLINFEAYF